MTIVVVWQEGEFQYCAADTRIVAGPHDRRTTESATKIYAIPLAVSAMGDGFVRQPHFWTQYGFAYSGAAFPATMTAVTASTLLQKLVRPGDRANPPTFEQIAEFVCRLSKQFMGERRQFEGDGLFDAAFFGWCHYQSIYKLALISGRADAGAFRVEMTFPERPTLDGDPWAAIGSGVPVFVKMLAELRERAPPTTPRVPRLIVDRMVREGRDPAVGGATSIGIAHRNGFDLHFVPEPYIEGHSAARRIFNGLDLDSLGGVGAYLVGVNGLA